MSFFLCDHLWMSAAYWFINIQTEFGQYPAIFSKQAWSISPLLLSTLRFSCCIRFIGNHVVDSPTEEWWTHCLCGRCLWRYMTNYNDNMYWGQEKCGGLIVSALDHVFWQDTSLSKCLSPPMCISRYLEFNVGGNPTMVDVCQICEGVKINGVSSFNSEPWPLLNDEWSK